MWNQILLVVLILAGLALYRYGRPILDALRRFDARNAARHAEEFQAQFDSLAHYRQTMRAAEEQVEAVAKIMVPDARTGVPLPRYLFLGTQYATPAEAEAARQSAVIAKARSFYLELDRVWLNGERSEGARARHAALPSPKGEDSTPPRP